jgi:hypothetical protein
MNKLQMDPPLSGGMARFFIKVQRQARPPAPWGWEIHLEGRAEAYRSSLRGYRSADEAWEAGRVALCRLGKPT